MNSYLSDFYLLQNHFWNSAIEVFEFSQIYQSRFHFLNALPKPSEKLFQQNFSNLQR